MRSGVRLASPKPVEYRLVLCIVYNRPDTSLVCSPEANPFAKKTETGPPKTGIGIGSKKPTTVASQKSLHKSETFFEKVEAAEMDASPPKRESEPMIIFPCV